MIRSLTQFPSAYDLIGGDCLGWSGFAIWPSCCGGNDVANNLLFLLTGIAGIAFASLFLAGLFALAGHPDHAWRPVKKLLVGLTVVVLAIWAICIFILFIGGILDLLGII